MKNIVKPALILTAICLVMTFAVAGVNLLTADTIAANEAKAAQESMNQLIPDVEFTAVEDDELVCSEAYKAGDKGYIFVSSAIGYGGEVRVMTALDTEGKVIGIIADQIAVVSDDIEEDTALEEDLDVDSLDLLQIVTAIEDEFDITVEDEAFETVRTVGDAVAYIEELV